MNMRLKHRDPIAAGIQLPLLKLDVTALQARVPTFHRRVLTALRGYRSHDTIVI